MAFDEAAGTIWPSARLVVEVILDGIVPQYFQVGVQKVVPFQDAMEDLEMLLAILDEVTPVQAVREVERAAIQERQGGRGAGGRTMAVKSGELGSLEAAASELPPGGLVAGPSRSRTSGPTQGGVTGQFTILSGGIVSGLAGIATRRTEAGAAHG